MDPVTMSVAAPIIGGVLGMFGSKKSGKKEATATNEPWKPQQPYLQKGYGRAEDWYQNQMRQNLPWTPPFSLVPQRNIYEQAYIDQLLASIPGMQQMIAQAQGAWGNMLNGGVSAPYSGAIGPGLAAAFGSTGAGTGVAGRNYGAQGFNPMSVSGAMPSYGNYQAPAPFTMREPQIEPTKLQFPLGYNPMGNLGDAMNKIAQGLPATSTEIPPQQLVNSPPIDYRASAAPTQEAAKPAAKAQTQADIDAKYMAGPGNLSTEEYDDYLKWWNTRGYGMTGG